MKYTVYLICNYNGLINEYIRLETDDKSQAIKRANDEVATNKLEKHPERLSVEVRYNENYENGSYEVLKF